MPNVLQRRLGLQPGSCFGIMKKVVPDGHQAWRQVEGEGGGITGKGQFIDAEQAFRQEDGEVSFHRC